MKKAMVFVLSAVSCAAQKGGAHSSDPSVTWTIYSGYQPTAGQPMLMQACDPTTTTGCIASAITGDGNIYRNGSSGVSNSVIHFDGATYDATLLVSSPRSTSFNLQHQVAS